MNERSARALLGVSLPATPGQIKRAYRRLALELHPDRGGDPAAFQRLVEAQDVLLGSQGTAQQAENTVSSSQRPPKSSWFEAPVERRRRLTSSPVARRRPTEPQVNGRRFGDVLAEKLSAA